MSAKPRRRRPLDEVFRIPLLLGLLSAAGLVAALIGDGWFDAFSFAALAVPVLVIGWCWRARAR